jgi:hypothetical protein
MRNILETKCMLRETLTAIGTAGHARQYVPCDRGTSYIEETGRNAEVCNEEHKCNWTQGPLEKAKLAQHSYKGVHRIYSKEPKALHIEPNTNRMHSYGPTLLWLIIWSVLDIKHCSRIHRTETPFIVDYVGNLCFYIGTTQKMCFGNIVFCSESTLVLCTQAVKICVAIGASPQVCGDFNIYLNSC